MAESRELNGELLTWSPFRMFRAKCYLFYYL